MAKSRSYKEAERRIKEARKTGRTFLDLSMLQLTELPDAIGYLTQLTKLILNGNQLTEIPEVLGNLTQLTTLQLADNLIFNLPESLGYLTKLEELNLTRNYLTELPESLANLTHLTNLYLGRHRLEKLPEWLGNLTSLTILRLWSNHRVELPESLGNLRQLRILDLDNIELTVIPNTLEKLTKLTELSCNKNKITELPEALGNLTQLTRLNLNNNQLTEIPESLGNLTKLTRLNLNNNQLTEIPESLGNLTKLMRLELKNNQLTEIPESLGNLTKLMRLELGENPLIPELATAYAKGIESVNAYLRELAKGSQERYEAKLLILGDGNEGKTCVSRALRGLPFEKQVTTRGVDVEQWTFPHPDDPEDERKQITLNIWDFEGQEINHQTHQFFLTDDSLYLLVFKCRDQFLLDRAEYWLDTIKARAPKARVTIVITECEERTPLIPEDRLISEYENVLTEDQWLFPVGCAEDLGIPELRDFLVCRAANLKHIGRKWPDSYERIETSIEEQTKAKRNHINRTQLHAIFADAGISESDFDEAANAIASIGAITQFPDCPDLGNFIVLQPQWLTKAISEIMEDKQLKDDYGKIYLRRMEKVWEEKRYTGMFPNFHDCMKEFELCYDLDDHNKACLVPLRFNYIKPKIPWSDIENAKERRVTYKLEIHPPLGFMARFIVKTHHLIRTNDKYPNGVFWHNGVFLQTGDGPYSSQALCEFDTLNRTLTITVRAAFPQSLIEQIHGYAKAVFSFFHGLKVKRSYGCIHIDEDTNKEKQCRGTYPEKLIHATIATNNQLVCQHECCTVDPRYLISGISSFGDSIRGVLREELDKQPVWADSVIHNMSTLLEWTTNNSQCLRQVHKDVKKITPELKQKLEQKFRDYLRYFGNLLDNRDFTSAPGIVLIEPVDRSNWNPQTYFTEEYVITPFCECEQNIHKHKDGCVRFTKDRDWWIKTAPWVSQGISILSMGLQIAITGLPLKLPTKVYEAIKNETAYMKELAKHLKLTAPDRNKPKEDFAEQFDDVSFASTISDEKEDRLMRTSLARLFEEIAPNNYKAQQWGTLRRVRMPDNTYRWLCEECAEKRKK